MLLIEELVLKDLKRTVLDKERDRCNDFDEEEQKGWIIYLRIKRGERRRKIGDGK